MTDDRSSRDAATPAPLQSESTDSTPAGRVDLNSRVERRLWQMRKNGDRAEARLCLKFGRREFRVYINDELLWSRNYDLGDTRQFDADVDAKYREMLGLGWELV